MKKVQLNENEKKMNSFSHKKNWENDEGRKEGRKDGRKERKKENYRKKVAPISPPTTPLL